MNESNNLNVRASQTTPPPVQQVIAAKPRTGMFAMVGRLVGAIMMILTIFAIGVYLGIGLSLTQASSAGVTLSQWRGVEGESKDRVVILPINGMNKGAQADFVRRCVDVTIRNYKKNNIKAIVLRVDSPGGFVTAADEIYANLKRLKEKTGLPIIASMGSVAASGGYYVSAGADKIYAQVTTVTGSIGVIAQVMTFGDTMKKLGIQPETRVASTSPYKDKANDLFRDWTDADWAEVQPRLDEMHARFIEVVKEGRGKIMSEEQLKVATSGRAFLGAEAMELGLVDEIGYIDDAIKEACLKAGLAPESTPVWIYGEPTGLLEGMIGVKSDQLAKPAFEMNAQAIRQTMTELGMPRMMYLYQK